MTGTPDIHVTRATEADIHAACAVLVEAVRWLEGRGEPLWKAEEFALERLAPCVTAGELFLARADGEVAGTFLLQEADPLFWPDDPPGTALYLHKLAVARAFAGRGVSRAILDWAAVEAARRGRAFLRLDCDGTRPALCAFYAAAGFTHVDTPRMGHWTAARFERAVVTPSRRP
jgi:GNAT superfamily N-acetyltransferase